MHQPYARLFARVSSLRPGRHVGALLLLLLAAAPAWAQHVVTGKVVDATTGEALIGVNIVEMGTQNGTTSDVDGNFRLAVTSSTSQLVFSYVGFVRKTVPIEGNNTLVVEMDADTRVLDDVVVTAFGIERKERALGYSVGQVSGDELAEVRDVNVVNALAGKVAGVLVSKPATGASGSSRVIIRGISTIDAGDANQPLYVVDGVPIDNTTISSAGMWGGVDGGDGISGVNPDDIESMTVLKGGAAAALYGSRALNGVIVITTKRGTRGAGLGVEFNSNTTFESVLVSTDFQETYGQGTRGEAPTSAEGAIATNTVAWGEKMNGQMVVNWDGVQRPYQSAGDNLGRFYDRGLTTTNTLALTTGTDNTTLRMSGSWLANDGITPSSGLSRGTFTLNGTARLGTKLTADAKLNFIREKVDNRPRLSDSPGNPNFSVFMLAPNVDVKTMRCPADAPDCKKLGATASGVELHPFESPYAQNPYWAATAFTQKDEERRIIGVTSLAYAFTDWLSLQGRFGGDTYTLRRTNIEPYGTAYTPRGSQTEESYDITELNTDFLLSLNRKVTPDLGLVANFGGNIQYSENESLTLGGGGGFNIPNLEVVTNQSTSSTGYNLIHKQVNSLYTQAEFAFKNYLFLTATGRNDWSSTLPKDNNSYFYPSVSASFVFTDAFGGMPAWLDYGKLRAAYANVGGDTYAYRLRLTYGLNGTSHLGHPRGGIAQGEIPLAGLKPYSSDEYEAGIDLRGLRNRIGLDFTYYSRETTNQILPISISGTSGFGGRVINVGAITNKGVEALLSTTPLLTQNIRWDVNFNFARNRNEVVSLLGENDVVRLGESRNQGNYVTAEVGKPFGVIRGNGYRLDDQGRRVFDADGLPVRTPEAKELGNAMPDWNGGLSTSFRYRRFTLSGLIDMRFGGDFYSALNANAYGNGLHKETLPGREGGIVGEGVALATCTENADGTLTGCQPNTVRADAQDYYGRIAGQIGEQFVYDASFVKLRELQLAYRVPTNLFGRSPIQDMTVSIVGRNLWLIHSNVPNLDPESSFRNDSAGIGLELAGVPQTRSIGFNINVRL